MPSTVIGSQGTTVSWGTTLGKVVSLSANFASPLKEIRQLASNLDEGGRYISIYEETTCDQSVDVEMLLGSSGSLTTANVGQKNELEVTGDGWSFTFPHAVLEKLTLTAKVADVVRVNATFRRSFS